MIAVNSEIEKYLNNVSMFQKNGDGFRGSSLKKIYDGFIDRQFTLVSKLTLHYNNCNDMPTHHYNKSTKL